MKPLATTILLLFFWVPSHSQLLDDFSHPMIQAHWNGDISHFVVNEDKMLQLQAPEGGSSFIYAHIDDSTTTHWALDFALDFDPSPSNLLQIFLSLSSPDLTSASGSFLELGSSGDQDKIQLYELIAGERILVTEGISTFGIHPSVRIEVTLMDSVLSLISIAEDGTANEEMNLISPFAPSKDRYFGMMCKYTESRKDKFSFDNIQVSSRESSEDISPQILAVEIGSSTQLILHFSKEMEKQSCENINNYFISPRIGSPGHATLLADPTMVQLDLSDSLISGEVYTLQSRDLRDLEGHTHFSEIELQYTADIEIQPYDLILHEIFDDPNPSFGLPEAEYLEIKCRRNGINTEGMQLKIGSAMVELPSMDLSVNDIILLHELDDSLLFAAFENAVGIKRFPTLVNTGNHIELWSPTGTIIDQVSYDDTWHTSDKNDGGFSLELINSNDGCALRENWTSSLALSGGTPGYENSVRNDSAYTSPRVINVTPLDLHTIEILINKSHHSSITKGQILLSPEIQAQRYEVIGANRNRIIVDIAPAMIKGTQYHVMLEGWKDCTGQSFENSNATFLIPEEMAPGDLVINEVLFDPESGGHDFIEIYNASSKAISLQDLVVTNTHTTRSTTFADHFLIRPNTYLVLTEDANDLASRYTVSERDWVIETSLPPLNNDAGNVTLFTARSGETIVIDAFDYDVGFHNALLKDPEGVSLERLYPKSVTQTRNNWHSAAGSAGYATPTSINSQIPRSTSITENWEIEPSIFSPDEDGNDDYAMIRYKDIAPGNYLHVKIYDSAGRLVRYLANNLSLQTSGEIKWDGSTDRNQKAAVGIYTIFIQLFNSNGIVNEIKETCVVAARLK